jgi:hypothetical protein
MHGPVSDFPAAGLSDLLGEISRVVVGLNGQPPDGMAQEVLSGYAAQVRVLAAAKRAPNRLPRAMRSQLKFVAYGLQILAGEVPSHHGGDLTADVGEMRQLLAACSRDAEKLNRP